MHRQNPPPEREKRKCVENPFQQMDENEGSEKKTTQDEENEKTQEKSSNVALDVEVIFFVPEAIWVVSLNCNSQCQLFSDSACQSFIFFIFFP